MLIEDNVATFYYHNITVGRLSSSRSSESVSDERGPGGFSTFR